MLTAEELDAIKERKGKELLRHIAAIQSFTTCGFFAGFYRPTSELSLIRSTCSTSPLPVPLHSYAGEYNGQVSQNTLSHRGTTKADSNYSIPTSSVRSSRSLLSSQSEIKLGTSRYKAAKAVIKDVLLLCSASYVHHPELWTGMELPHKSDRYEFEAFFYTIIRQYIAWKVTEHNEISYWPYGESHHQQVE